ncbi:MAG TPA: hypothetical protein VL221_07765 [Bacteroidota bacterium]|nr:hypothetical protein [Bacteroidota bacterium]
MDKSEAPFKRCSMCRKEWLTREEFLADRSMYLDGYQVNRRRIEAGLPPEGILLFTHKTKACGTTLGISASKFRFAR